MRRLLTHRIFPCSPLSDSQLISVEYEAKHDCKQYHFLFCSFENFERVHILEEMWWLALDASQET